MSDEPMVHVSAATLTRAWRTAGREEFWIQLTTTHADRDTFAAAIQELEDPLDDVCFLVRTHGTVPKGYVALVSGTGDDTQLVVWADALARHLEAHGVTGTLTGVTPARASNWIRAEPPVPTAFLTWSYDAANFSTNPVTTDDPGGRLWKPDPDTTRAIAELVTDFARPGGAKSLLSQGAFQFAIATTDDLADMLCAAILSDGGQAGLWCIDDTTHTARKAALGCAAQTVLKLVGDTPTWQQRVDVLLDTITARADLVDHAFIRTAYQSPHSFTDVTGAVPIPHADEAAFRYNQHLTISHVIDVNGIQVLTDTHLERLRHPEHWHIDDLGNGRHLVTAPDLAAWYATTTPDPATVDQARLDFADLLLTTEAIATNPPPWATPG
jgi:hypothetical protein